MYTICIFVMPPFFSLNTPYFLYWIWVFSIWCLRWSKSIYCYYYYFWLSFLVVSFPVHFVIIHCCLISILFYSEENFGAWIVYSMWEKVHVFPQRSWQHCRSETTLAPSRLSGIIQTRQVQLPFLAANIKLSLQTSVLISALILKLHHFKCTHTAHI